MPDSIKAIKQELDALLTKAHPDRRAILALLKRAHTLGASEGVAVRQAAETWVKAEALFRLGPVAYQNGPTDQYLEAEARLRAVLTGHANLRPAGEALGVVLIPLYSPGRSRGRR